MAGTAIVRKDTRLLLFQALERGSFEGSFLQKMKKDGAGMTYEFAKKYYKVTFEVYLIQASYCVLGIINFGLHLLSDNDLDKAVMILQTRSLMEIFQAGWTKISDVAASNIRKDNEWSTKSGKNANKVRLPGESKEIIWHREISERLLANPASNWDGLEEFRKLHKEIAWFEGQHQLFKFFRQKFDPSNPQARKRGIYKMDTDKPVILLDTYYLSLLVSDTPKAPLEAEDLVKITEQLGDKQLKKKLLAKWSNFQGIPDELKPWHQAQIRTTLKTINYLQSILAAKGEGRLYEQYYTQLYILADLNKTSELRYTSAKELLRGNSDGNINALVTSLYEATDASDRLACLHLIFEKPKKLSAENILDVIKAEDVPWQQKLRWYELKRDTLQDVLESEFQSEIIADILAQHHESLLLYAFEKLPGNLLLEIMSKNKILRDYLLENIFTPESVLNQRDVSVDAHILFVPLSSWPKMWNLMETIHGPVIFERMRKFYREIGFSAKETEQLLWERILKTAEYYRDKEVTDFEKCAKPFYSDLFKEAVQNAYTKSGFLNLKKKLLKALK